MKQDFYAVLGVARDSSEADIKKAYREHIREWHPDRMSSLGYSARDVIAAARQLGLRVEGDLRNEKINYKVREHSLAKVPVLLVVGRKEAADRTVSIRRLGKEGQSVLGLDAALRSLLEEAVPPDIRRMKQAA